MSHNVVRYPSGREVVYYSTQDEMKFIDGIGTYTQDDRYTTSRVHKHSRVELLIGYYMSIPGRYEWGNINKSIIEKYVEEAIAKEIKPDVVRQDNSEESTSEL